MKLITYKKLKAAQKAEVAKEFPKGDAAAYDYHFDDAGRMVYRIPSAGGPVEAVRSEIPLEAAPVEAEPAVAHVRHDIEKLCGKVELTLLRREEITPWAGQPRRRFDAVKLEELVTSMRAHGFLEHSPLLVRRLAPEVGESIVWRFEIVAGERRWRAAGVAGIELIPCVVRSMSDTEAHELALVENLQRDDLSELEEAEGYQSLLNLCEADGTAAHTVETLAEKVGRSTRHIRERLSICRLRGEVAGLALECGELPYSQALRIARLPSVTLREEVTGKVLKNSLGPSPMPVKDLEQLLREEYQRALPGARFDRADALLVPVVLDADGLRLMGGACEDCPHNTKNAVGEVERERQGGARQMCQNPECYAAKDAARYEVWRASVDDPKKNRSTLPAEESEELWGYGGGTLCWNSSYVELTGKPTQAHIKQRLEVDQIPTWAELTQGRVPVVVVEDLNGKVHELVKEALALEAARETNPRLFKGTASGGGSEDEEENDDEAQETSAAQDREKEKLIYVLSEKAVIEGVLGASSISARLWDALFATLVKRQAQEDDEPLAELAGELGWQQSEEEWKDEDYPGAFLMARVSEFPERQKVAMVVQFVLRTQYGLRNAALLDFAGVLEIDLDKTVAVAEAELAAKAEREQALAAIASGLKWDRKREEAEEFEWNEHGMCEEPDICRPDFPGLRNAVLMVEVARGRRGWYSGFEFKIGTEGDGSSPRDTNVAYDTRALALRAGLLELGEFFAQAGVAEKHVTLLDAYVELVEGGAL